ncbi:MAG: DUF1049 domain-containing protein [Proteobacteria bacterium]|nr:DUF1049 domain-containing protein [Pseudomonadota bacterium]
MNTVKSILRTLRSTILLLLLICMVVFMVDNRDVITINTNPLPFEIQTRVFVVMIFCFVLGLIFGILSCSPTIIQNFFRRLRDRNKIKKLEKQLGN